MDNRRKRKGNQVFLKTFLKNPLRTGSIVQSSPVLAEKLLKEIDFKSARCIVELGGGAGIITKKILEKMHGDCVLLCFEIEPALAEKIDKLGDPRLKVICESAENIHMHLRSYGFQKTDCIISSLPLASLPPRVSRSILKNIYTYLSSGGRYVQFQYSLATLRQIKYLFSTVAVSFVFLNIPPAFIYVCVKN